MAAHTQASDVAESTAITLFSYTIDRFNILLERDLKTEIIGQQATFPIPHAPGWCSGMISLRGKLIPVLSLHRSLADNAPRADKWLLVVESSPLPQIAISIDSLPSQRQIKPDDFTAVDNDSLPRWLIQQCVISGKTFYRANHHELFEQLIHENDTQQSALEIEV